MKLNQTLTAVITAAALVAGAGFAYAQTANTTPGAPGELNRQGAAEMKAPDVNPAAGTTMQSRPSTSTTSGTSMDNSATMQGGTVLPEPRADRN